MKPVICKPCFYGKVLNVTPNKRVSQDYTVMARFPRIQWMMTFNENLKYQQLTVPAAKGKL